MQIAPFVREKQVGECGDRGKWRLHFVREPDNEFTGIHFTSRLAIETVAGGGRFPLSFEGVAVPLVGSP